MPSFSATSKERLATCHPDLQAVMSRVIEVFDIKVLEGHRPKERQNSLYQLGRSQVSWPHSKHNAKPAEAVDVAPYPIDWENRARFHYMGGLILGIAEEMYRNGEITHRLVWGGDWNENDDPSDESFYDGPHFQLAEE